VTVLAVALFVGCGVDSGSGTGRPAYETSSIGTGSPNGGTGGGTGGGSSGGDTGGGSTTGSASQAEKEVFDITNEERAKEGLSALSWCDQLAACARAHSCDMCDRNFFSHTNPDGEGPSDRARAGHAGSYTFDSITPNPYSWGVAENIGRVVPTAAEMMNIWMNSASHRRNILNSTYTHLGVGVREGKCSDCPHWTQNFGTR
jgi:uncharacterized protein YkwD